MLFYLNFNDKITKLKKRKEKTLTRNVFFFKDNKEIYLFYSVMLNIIKNYLNRVHKQLKIKQHPPTIHIKLFLLFFSLLDKIGDNWLEGYHI